MGAEKCSRAAARATWIAALNIRERQPTAVSLPLTGALDRVDDRKAFLELARAANVPILVVYGAQTPRKSRLEMEAMAELSNVQVKRLAKGKLAVHEKFPDAIADAIIPFLDE